MRVRSQIILLRLGIIVFPMVFLFFWTLGGGRLDEFPAAALRVGSSPIPFLLLPFVLLVVTGFFGLFIVRSLRLSLARLARAPSRLADGDLDTPVEVAGREEVAILGTALEDLRLALRDERARRSRLILGVSHDFRTPIALIRGYAEALGDRVAPDRETEARWLGIIRDKTGELEALVDDLLGYVRMESDQRRGVQPIVGLRAFFRDLAAEFAEDAAMRERSFSYSDLVASPGAVGGELHASLDSSAAARAFRNLFGNALRYTGSGGKISMELSKLGDGLLVSMLDDGIGIAPEEVASIFDPFFRGRNVGARQGSGLGLAVVKSVIDSHGWGISCTSEPGIGTRFTVTIPLDWPPRRLSGESAEGSATGQ